MNLPNEIYHEIKKNSKENNNTEKALNIYLKTVIFNLYIPQYAIKILTNNTWNACSNWDTWGWNLDQKKQSQEECNRSDDICEGIRIFNILSQYPASAAMQGYDLKHQLALCPHLMLPNPLSTSSSFIFAFC